MNHITGTLEYLQGQQVKLCNTGHVTHITPHGHKSGYNDKTKEHDYMEDWYILSFHKP